MVSFSRLARSAQAAGWGTQQKRNFAGVAASGESVVRDFFRSHAGCTFAFLFFLNLLSLPAFPQASALGLASNDGFCLQDPAVWPPNLPPGVTGWTSRCGPAPANALAHAVTQPFRAERMLTLYLAGLFDRARVKLALENVATHQALTLDPAQTPGGTWNLTQFLIPAPWRGQFVRLNVTAERSGDFGWLGFSPPVPVPDTGPTDTFKLLLRTVEHFALFSFLFFAVCAVAVRRGLSDTCLLVLVGLAGLAAAGYLAFWLWFFSPHIGRMYSVLVQAGALVFLLFTLRRMSASERRILGLTAAPWLLTLAWTIFVLSAGFFYGGLDDPLQTTNTRFTHLLPSDNYLPFAFAEALRKGHVLKPFFIDWLSSDRPPLQTGFTLLEFPFVLPREPLPTWCSRSFCKASGRPPCGAFWRPLE